MFASRRINRSVTSRKISELRKLTKKRQRIEGWKQYKNLCAYGSRYECDFVSPYTKSACNVDSSLFIMLQDWASADFLRRPLCEVTRHYGRTPWRATNKRLDELLKKHCCWSIGGTYASNVFPLIKPGSMTAGIPEEDLKRAAIEFGLKQ